MVALLDPYLSFNSPNTPLTVSVILPVSSTATFPLYIQPWTTGGGCSESVTGGNQQTHTPPVKYFAKSPFAHYAVLPTAIPLITTCKTSHIIDDTQGV